MKIAFQGELGAYSHQAVVENYAKAEALPKQTFEGAIEAVRVGEADLAMIPVENSTYGRVSDVHHLLPSAGLNIIAECFLPVKINWWGRKSQNASLATKAISHPVLLGQCRKFMLDSGLSWEAWSDTAAAAKYVANSTDSSLTALASPLAGEIYGLELFAEGVEDAQNNATRFLVLSNQEVSEPQGSNVMTTFIFQVRNIPAALYKAMGGFATNGVNMTKLESYMVDGNFTATQFYADIEGHPDDENVKLAFEELRFYTNEFRVLGVYQAAKGRVGR